MQFLYLLADYSVGHIIVTVLLMRVIDCCCSSNLVLQYVAA